MAHAYTRLSNNPTLILTAEAAGMDYCTTLIFELDKAVQYSITLNRTLRAALDSFEETGTYIRTLVPNAYISTPPPAVSDDNHPLFIIPVSEGKLAFHIRPSDLKDLFKSLKDTFKPKTRPAGWYRVKLSGLAVLPSGKYQVTDAHCGTSSTNSMGGCGYYSSPVGTIMAYLTPDNHILV